MIVKPVRKKMMKLLPHHRLHIPNGLAMLAALLLLISSVTGVKNSAEDQHAGDGVAAQTRVEASENSDIADTAMPKRRGLNLGLLLFRR